MEHDNANAAYNVALNTYNAAVNANSQAQNSLQQDTDSLTATETSCQQPVHAPNCPQLIDAAKEKVVEAQGTLTRTTSVMADAKTKSDTASDELDTATDNLNNAIANKQKEVKDLQQTINDAIASKNSAVENYAEVAAECN